MTIPTRLTSSEILNFLRNCNYAPVCDVDGKAWLIMDKATGREYIAHVMTEDEFARAVKIKKADTDAMRNRESVLTPGVHDHKRIILTERYHIGCATELALIFVDPIKEYSHDN